MVRVKALMVQHQGDAQRGILGVLGVLGVARADDFQSPRRDADGVGLRRYRDGQGHGASPCTPQGRQVGSSAVTCPKAERPQGPGRRLVHHGARHVLTGAAQHHYRRALAQATAQPHPDPPVVRRTAPGLLTLHYPSYIYIYATFPYLTLPRGELWSREVRSANPSSTALHSGTTIMLL